MNYKELNLLIRNYKKSGNNSYFEKIYQHFLPKIYRFIFLKILDRQVSEDLTSEVFLKVYNNLKKTNLNSATFNAWIYKIAKNTLVDYYRKENKHENKVVSFEQYVDENKESAVIDKKLMLEQKFLDKEFQFENEKLVNILSKLPEQQREVVLLRYLDELDFKTIGAILKKNPSSARVINFRALLNIKKELNKQNDFKK